MDGSGHWLPIATNVGWFQGSCTVGAPSLELAKECPPRNHAFFLTARIFWYLERCGLLLQLQIYFLVEQNQMWLESMSIRGPKVLVSACLLGRPVRYDGSSKSLNNEHISRWAAEGRVISVCPEMLAGLPTPRPPAEIAGGQSGAAVLSGDAVILEAGGRDVTATYVEGARAALALASRHGCQYALLMDGSPSCGVSFIYDGSFTGRRQSGDGATAALLRQHKIQVFDQTAMPIWRA